jgi:fructokinase
MTIFDVNLRPPDWEYSRVMDLARQSDVMKLNLDELALLADGNGLEQRARTLASSTGATTICVTLGSDGAALLHHRTWCTVPAMASEVIDTVGAGDAFLAVLVDAILAGSFDPKETLHRAVRLAGYVVSHEGATPAYDPAEVLQM